MSKEMSRFLGHLAAVVEYSYMAKSEESEPISLDAERTRKFLRTLAEDPFLAVVVAADGEVTVYSKGLEPDHLERIKEVLTQVQQEG